MLRKRLQLRMLGGLLAAATVALSATPASAGTYNVNSCSKSATRSQADWTFEETAGQSGGIPYFYTVTDCSSYGWYRRFENTSIAGGAYEASTFYAPAGTYIDQATLYQSIAPRSAGAYDAIYGELADGGRRTIANYLGNTGTTVGDTTYQMPSSGAHVVRLRTELGCQASVGSCPGLSGAEYGNTWQLMGTVMRLVDPSTPSFSATGGAGWTGAPADGVSPVTYSVADTGAGVSKVEFLVDGIVNASKASTCTAGTSVPCPLTSTGQFVLDTTLLSEGQHTIALVATDYSGNATLATDKQMTITVRRPPQVSTSSPVTTTDPSANGGGSPAVGDHLGGSGGSWAGDGITYVYQWMRCDAQGLNCAPIAGANGLNYTATNADLGKTLEFCVTATNSGGSATSCSAPTPVVIASHPVTTPPSSGSSDSRDSATPNSVGGPTPAPTRSNVGSGSTSTADRGAPNGSPAAERVVLTALANSRTSTQKVKYGKRVPITGRLVGPNGAPIAGALLSVQVQTAVPGASMADAAQVVTSVDGRFSYTAPAGPSRVIRFGYRTYTADTAFADTTDVRLLVSAGVTMKATPKKVHNKHATVFKGRLLGKPIAPRGVVVDLQVFFRKHWRTFAAPRTNKAGAYKFKYRFMAGAAIWKFRARVRHESSYPYESGVLAKPIKVKVLR